MPQTAGVRTSAYLKGKRPFYPSLARKSLTNKATKSPAPAGKGLPAEQAMPGSCGMLDVHVRTTTVWFKRSRHSTAITKAPISTRTVTSSSRGESQNGRSSLKRLQRGQQGAQDWELSHLQCVKRFEINAAVNTGVDNHQSCSPQQEQSYRSWNTGRTALRSHPLGFKPRSLRT